MTDTNQIKENEVIVTGALLDNRLEEEQNRDWTHDELFAGAMPTNWREKSLSEIRRASPRNQGMSLSCVANGGAIALELAEKLETGNVIVFSHKDIYIRRVNRIPNRLSGGMNMPDLFRILRDGACYESQVPSMNLSETPINQEYPITADILKARATHASKASVFIVKRNGAYNMDDVAQAIEMGVPVIAFWYFSNKNAYAEWWRTQPQIVEADLPLYDPKDDNRVLHHQATIIDYTMLDGKRFFYVQDSAGVGTGLSEHRDIRLVSEEFFMKRIYGLGYSIDKSNLDYKPEVEKLRYNFTRSLKFNDVGEDVKALQRILVAENVLVLKEPTGNFKGATLNAVIKLQEKYAKQILAPLGLKKGTGFVGKSTLAFLKANYGLN